MLCLHRARYFPALALASLAGLACGGTGSQTTSAATGSSSSATSSASGTTSSGTGGGSTTGASTASSSSAGTGGGGGPCVGHIDLAIDNKALQHFAFECNGDFDASQSTTPVGYQFAGNLPGEPQGLRIVGCKTSAAKSEGVVLDALNASAPGTYTMGTPQYTDPNGMVWGTGADPFNMVVTKLGPTGQPIEGTFTVSSTQGGSAAHALAGSFHVCHGGDFFPP